MTEPRLPTEDELMQRVALCSADLREWAEKEGYANLSARIASCVRPCPQVFPPALLKIVLVHQGTLAKAKEAFTCICD